MLGGSLVTQALPGGFRNSPARLPAPPCLRRVHGQEEKPPGGCRRSALEPQGSLLSPQAPASVPRTP